MCPLALRVGGVTSRHDVLVDTLADISFTHLMRDYGQRDENSSRDREERCGCM